MGLGWLDALVSKGWTPHLLARYCHRVGNACRPAEPCAKASAPVPVINAFFLNASLSMLFSQFNCSISNLPSPILHRDSTNDHVGSCQ
jgi:hypothetical protein